VAIGNLGFGAGIIAAWLVVDEKKIRRGFIGLNKSTGGFWDAGHTNNK
jgi:hypothetical protein